MGDEAQKRTTDCVYFLASPLTCKKGNECEYRHSEAARINPRDCWYWLSGNCLNANCSFRHPPLDGRPGASASTPSPLTGGTLAAATTTAAPSATASSSSTVPVPNSASKSTVPCFFFSQGYCAKGGKCSFSHGPPTYRKEATNTYRKPEQPANAEGNGFSYVKQQSQDSKLTSQTKPPVKVAISPQESGFTPSNVYKLTLPKGSILVGEKADQNSHTGKSKLVHSTNDTSTRQGQLVESRISQAHLGDDRMQQAAPVDKGGMKGQSSQLDIGRRIQKQGRQQTSATYNVRTSEELISSEMQDSMFEPDAQHGARELHAGDLRNHLKRKKNDTAYLSQLKNFHRKEYPKESGRLASRAVAVVESEDFVPSNAKRAKEDKENFSGPKTLAQIKAEKTKVGAEDSFKGADCRSQGQDMVSPDPEVKGKVQLASEVHGNPLSESREAGNHAGHADEDLESELKKARVPIPGASKEFEGSSCKSAVLQLSLGTRNSNGISSDSLPLREVETAASHSSENVEKHDGHKVDVLAYRKEGKQDFRREGTLEGGTHSYYNVDCLQVSGTETEYISADDPMEDGTEAHAVYTSDYDEDDDFARKLGSFLS